MDVRQLSAFLAVVEHGTVTAAAAAIHVTQPALSQTIRSMEAEGGVPLFHRIGGRLRLTAAGEALVAPARQVVRDLDAARAALAAVAGVAAGTLDLAVLPTLAVDPTAALVGRFRQSHPGVVVRVLAGDEGDVRSGTAEVALIDAARAEGLVVHELGTQAYRAVFPPGAAPRARRVSAAALVGVPMVTTPPGTSTREIVDRFVGAPVVAVEASAREAILPLVVAGAGAALLPAPLAEQAASLGADVRALDPPVTRTVGLVHRDATLSPAAAAFVRLGTAR